MRTVSLKIDDWLRHEAHVVAGHPFQIGDFSCVPVAPETLRQEKETPTGFLVTHGSDVSFIAAQTPDGEQLMRVWTKNHLLEVMEENQALPAECWYG
jgi:hypothetical protein